MRLPLHFGGERLSLLLVQPFLEEGDLLPVEDLARLLVFLVTSTFRSDAVELLVFRSSHVLLDLILKIFLSLEVIIAEDNLILA